MSIKVKICGLTNLRDARHAAACGADYVGFVMVPHSPRYIAPEKVAEIVRQLPPGLMKVGVFVDRKLDDMRRIVSDCGLDIVQLHGDETPDMAVELGIERVWKVFSIRSAGDVAAAARFPAAVILVDTMVSGQRGGTGQLGDWMLAAALAEARPVILAGGLNSSNVEEAVRTVRPFGVDVSSGVEITAGRKKLREVKEFILKARCRERQKAEG